MADFKSELRKDQYKVLFAVTMLTEKTQTRSRTKTENQPNQNHTTKNNTNKTKKTG